MASNQATAGGDRIETNVYHDGDEVAVRARSQHSRAAHDPETDDDGNVVFDDDGHPAPACDGSPDPDTEWVLRPVEHVDTRDKCRPCFNADELAEQNTANAASKTIARRLRYGESWGEE